MGERVRGPANGRYRRPLGRWRESLRGWGVNLAITGVIGLFLGLVGPFGTYLNGPPWQRIAYWLGSVWVGTLVFGSVVRFVRRRTSTPGRHVLVLVATVLAVAAPFALANRMFAFALWPSLIEIHAITPWLWYLQVLVISAPQVALFELLEGRRERSHARTAGDPPPVEGLLGAPPDQVLCLQMEDHYVRVHTASGSRLVLATLAQATAALKGAAGLQVHRSWWVAEKAVARAVADGRNLRLELTNGVTAPVARTSVAAVRAAGWLER